MQACLEIILDKAPLLCHDEDMEQDNTTETGRAAPERSTEDEHAAFARLAEQHEVALERASGCYETEGVQA